MKSRNKGKEDLSHSQQIKLNNYCQPLAHEKGGSLSNLNCQRGLKVGCMLEQKYLEGQNLKKERVKKYKK